MNDLSLFLLPSSRVVVCIVVVVVGMVFVVVVGVVVVVVVDAAKEMVVVAKKNQIRNKFFRYDIEHFYIVECIQNLFIRNVLYLRKYDIHTCYSDCMYRFGGIN